jgi:poly(3-hydroxybutyrate) depolymerase
MQKLIIFIIAPLFIAQAQCDERYIEEIFTEFNVSTETYSDMHNLQVDIYQPEGDLVDNRPLLILAHGGSFIAGVRTNPSMVSLAEKFSKKGFVVASISYRLMSFMELVTASGALNGVARALSDGRAAVRYFRKTISEGNPYKIDTNQIYFGGNSAGAVIAIHIAFMDLEDISDPDLLNAINNNGGIIGDSGNEEYSSEIRGAISLAGGIANLDFIEASDFDKLLISCHGDQDPTVPYMCGQPLGISVLPQLCGGGSMLEHSNEMNFENFHHLLFEGAGHVPWEYGGLSEELMVDFVTEKLYENLDCFEVGLSNINYTLPTLYPNPIRDIVQISHSKKIISIKIRNINGQIIMTETNLTSLSLSEIPEGFYCVDILDENNNIAHLKILKQ